MRITRLKLVNFIGIKHGLGLDELELVIPKTDNKIILLAGDNGSGKSTILAALHPFKDSLFDDRKEIILDGKEGRKEIDIEADGHLYEIVHTYGTAAQSFFTKDGEELNDNGGVRTCEQLIQKELGVKKDFFRISKIGSNTEGFIDLAPTDRKNFVGTFLNIDDIISKFKIVSEKMKTLKKDIAGLTSELGKYESEEILQAEVNKNQTKKKENENSLKELYKMQGSLMSDMKKIDEEIGDESLINLQKTARELSVALASNTAILETLKKEAIKFDNPEASKNKLNEEINKLNGKLQGNNSAKKIAYEQYVENKNKVETLNIEMNSLGNPSDLEKLNNEIAEQEKKIETLKNKIKNNPYGNLMREFMSQKKEVSKYLSKFQDFTDFVEKYFKELGSNDISLSKINLEYFFDENFKETFDRLTYESRKAIETKNALLEQMQKEKATAETYVGQLSNLNKRPAECHIDTCPFIKEALLHKNVLSEISEKEEAIKNIKNDIELLDHKAENLQSLSNLYSYFTQNYNALMPRDNMIYLEFIRIKTLVNWVKGPLSDFQRIRQEIIYDMNQADSDVFEFKEIAGKKIQNENLKKVIEDSDSSVREKYQKDIEEFKEKTQKSKEKFDNLDNIGKELSDKIKNKTELKNKYEKFIAASNKVEELNKELSKANEKITKLTELLGKKHDADINLSSTNTTIGNIEENIKECDKLILKDQTALAQRESLNNRLESLNKTYSPVISVANALNPSKGIPLIFMQNYLEETETIANDLLSLAFGDNFKINFVASEKEFNIQVKVGNEIKSDIKVASQGEISLTTISISLALIEQSIGNYNILCLDELDGPLAKRNREIFIDILNKQISKLDIEQMFIISHNDAFDIAPVDLILLKDHGMNIEDESFMENKNIIFNAESN